MNGIVLRLVMLGGLVVLVASGCTDNAAPQEENAASHGHDDHGEDGHGEHGHDHGDGGHGHSAEGPHHGDVIELGHDEEYHAELVHGDRVAVYILDGSARESVAIDVQELTLNVTHDGKPGQFVLNADPQDGDEEGKTSCFASEDSELVKQLESDEVTIALVLNINGKSYRGKLEHAHDDGHDHGEHGGH